MFKEKLDNSNICFMKLFPVRLVQIYVLTWIKNHKNERCVIQLSPTDICRVDLFIWQK